MRADRARFFHRRQRADLRPERVRSRRPPIRRRRARSDAGRASARGGHGAPSDNVRTNALRASSAARRSDSFDSGSISGRGSGGRREVTGPPWPFALKSSDAKTSGGRHVIRPPDQMVRAGTAPKWIESPQGFSEGSHRVVPVATNLGICGLALKCLGEQFEAVGERFGALDQRGVGRGWIAAAAASRASCRSAGRPSSSEANRNWRASDSVPSPDSASRLLPSTRRRGGAQILLLAVAARDLVGAAGDGQVDQRRPSGGRLADQLVELLDHLAHLGAKLRRRGPAGAASAPRASARSAGARARRGRVQSRAPHRPLPVQLSTFSRFRGKH